jgi:hypothetical protein
VNVAVVALEAGLSRHTHSLNPGRVVPSAKYQVLLALVQPTTSCPPFHAASAAGVIMAITRRENAVTAAVRRTRFTIDLLHLP